MTSANDVQHGPPYLPHIAKLGGTPTVDEDVPALSVLIAIYLAGAVAYQTTLQLNRRKGHRFYMCGAMFGFCMSRVGTCVLRLAWATRLSNIRLAIAASIFINLGVLVVYIVVLLLALRVFRATHPRLGWNTSFAKILTVSYVVLAIAILAVIAFTVVSFYTLDSTLKAVCLWIQRAAILYMLIFNIASMILLLLSLLLPRSPDAENFGAGSMSAKFIILAIAVFFSNFIAGFRTGTAWAHSRPGSDPAWYDSKGAFYGILLGFEIVIVYLFIFSKFDERFWVPNGSRKPGDFARVDLVDKEEIGSEK